MVQTLRSLAFLADHGADATWRLHDIIVIDNDRLPTAQPTVEALVTSGYPLAVRYCHEPRPGLAAARNRAIDEAQADVLVFIDDDEKAEAGWPDGLLATMAATGAALVGGPVRTAFSHQPAAWIVDGGFFERAEPPDQTPQSWLRSGNLALDLAQIRAHDLRFDSRFGHSGGEDTAFSFQAAGLGLGLQWSATAVVTEIVGPDRTTLRWLARRERRSTANWVRVEVGQDNSRHRRLLVAARAAARFTQGLAVAVAGTALARRAMAARGWLLMARAVGAIHGLIGGTSTSYGQPADG